MTSVDGPLLTARHEVEHLFGQCILRLQVFELALKSIVAGHRVPGSWATFEDARTNRIAKVRRKTLGELVSEMMGSVLVPDVQNGQRAESDRDAEFACSVRIAFPAVEFARIETEHRELVALRNTLPLRMFPSTSASSKNLRRACDQHSAGRTGPGFRSPR